LILDKAYEDLQVSLEALQEEDQQKAIAFVIAAMHGMLAYLELKEEE